MSDIIDRLNGVPNDTAKEAIEEIIKLREIVTMRGARMQVMYEYLQELEEDHIWIDTYDFKYWFDEKGLPK